MTKIKRKQAFLYFFNSFIVNASNNFQSMLFILFRMYDYFNSNFKLFICFKFFLSNTFTRLIFSQIFDLNFTQHFSNFARTRQHFYFSFFNLFETSINNTNSTTFAFVNNSNYIISFNINFFNYRFFRKIQSSSFSFFISSYRQSKISKRDISTSFALFELFLQKEKKTSFSNISSIHTQTFIRFILVRQFDLFIITSRSFSIRFFRVIFFKSTIFIFFQNNAQKNRNKINFSRFSTIDFVSSRIKFSILSQKTSHAFHQNRDHLFFDSIFRSWCLIDDDRMNNDYDVDENDENDQHQKKKKENEFIQMNNTNFFVSNFKFLFQTSYVKSSDSFSFFFLIKHHRTRTSDWINHYTVFFRQSFLRRIFFELFTSFNQSKSNHTTSSFTRNNDLIFDLNDEIYEFDHVINAFSFFIFEYFRSSEINESFIFQKSREHTEHRFASCDEIYMHLRYVIYSLQIIYFLSIVLLIFAQIMMFFLFRTTSKTWKKFKNIW